MYFFFKQQQQQNHHDFQFVLPCNQRNTKKVHFVLPCGQWNMKRSILSTAPNWNYHIQYFRELTFTKHWTEDIKNLKWRILLSVWLKLSYILSVPSDMTYVIHASTTWSHSFPPIYLRNQFPCIRLLFKPMRGGFCLFVCFFGGRGQSVKGKSHYFIHKKKILLNCCIPIQYQACTLPMFNKCTSIKNCISHGCAKDLDFSLLRNCQYIPNIKKLTILRSFSCSFWMKRLLHWILAYYTRRF